MSTSLQPPHEPLPQDPAGPDPYPSADPAVLDDPAWNALTGPHRHLAETVGAAARYRADISPFIGLADRDDPRSWQDLARLIGPGNSFVLVALPGPPEEPRLPEEWKAADPPIRGVQLVGTALRAEPEPAAVRLGAADVPQMLDLVERTRPGPFTRRTIEMGAYYGVRRDGKLVAMVGERMRPPGWTEISAVCTDPAYRGQGLAARLIRHTAVGILGRGDTPFLHAAGGNTGAIRLYESLGFTLRSTAVFHSLRVPADALDGRR
jgi:ribosomal protein S18 acetylase RimI-like enzyme